jgi:voltage-gated potassium channel
VVDGDDHDDDGMAADGEGRVLCLLLSVYAFTVFGYVTAALASYVIGRDAEGVKDATSDIRKELSELREELRASRKAADE